MNPAYKTVRDNFIRQSNPDMVTQGLSRRDRENLGRALSMLDDWAADHPNASTQELTGQANQLMRVAHPETIFEHYTGLPDRYRVNAINALSGWEDTLTFGLTEDFRELIGLNKDLNKNTTAYGVGEVAGIGTGMLFGGIEGLEAAGTKAPGMEFSHWIPNRMGGPRSLWNGNYVTKVDHALSDPYRYRFMPKWWKEFFKPPYRAVQQWVRVPKVYKGGGAGAAAATIGADYSRSDEHW
jgi:hypothetical protein